MVAMNLNSHTYVIAVDNTSKKASLTPDDGNLSSVVISNESTKSSFVYSSTNASDTAVFPSSATVPANGTVVLPGAIVTFYKNIGDNYIYAIQSVAGTGNLYIKTGSGE